MRIIFVDAYNVINSWPILKNIKEYDFGSARYKLIELLQNYAAYNGNKIIIVFDAHLSNTSVEKKEKVNEYINVVFTKSGETADSFIERSVNNIGRKSEVWVVTSDSLEQQVTFQRGAIRMSSLEFYFEVKDIETKIKVKTEKRYSEKRNLLENNIDPQVLEKLEKIRRSK